MKFFYCATVVLLLFVVGCSSVGPDYESPEVEIPELKVSQVEAGAEITVEESEAWWQLFNDPVLSNLVTRSISSNLTVRAGVARLREARARLGVSKAGLLPEVDVGGFYRRYRNSDNVGYPLDGDFYHAGFDAAWELDIFGRRRRAIEAAAAAFDAEVASLESVWVSLAAETTHAYVQLQTLRQRLQVAERNLAVQGDTLELLSSRAEAGLSDKLVVEQARYNLEYTRATLPALEGQIESTVHRLAVLTGVMPGMLEEELTAEAPIPTIEPRMLVGVPADLLRRRPDVRLAERRLAAQTAQIGVATADLYPTLRLTGSIGLESLEADDFFKSGSRFFAITPAIVWPIFHGGSIRANIEVQSALQEQAVIEYERVVLEAVRELHDALTSYSHEFRKCEALKTAAASARGAMELAQNQYTNGLATFNNVLDAQRSLLSFEESVVISEGAITDHLIRIYKALGGGWQPLVAE